MGNFLSRSPSQLLGMRRKRDKRQPLAEPEPYLDEDGNGYEGSNKESVYKYQQWQSMTNEEQTNYSHVSSAALMAHATIPLWTHHADHTFHQSNPPPMVSASRPAFDYHQQPSRQHRTSPVKPLRNTQSWQEPNHAAQSLSSQPVTKSERFPTYPSIFVIPIAAGSPVSKMKAVYVPIDHNATIAERRLIQAQHQRHQSNDRNLSDRLSKTHRSRPHRHRYQIDSSSSIGNIHSSDSIDTGPVKSSSAHRSSSTSQSIPNSVQTSSSNNEIESSKMKKYRSEHVSVNNEQGPSRRHRHPTSAVPKEESSHSQMRTGTSDRQHSTAPMMRITLARPDQARQKQTATRTRTSTKDSHARSHLQTALF